MSSHIDDWLEASYEERYGSAYDPQDDPRTEEYTTYDAPECITCDKELDPDEVVVAGECEQCREDAEYESHLDFESVEVNSHDDTDDEDGLPWN